MPYGAQIALILLSGVIASVVVLFAVNSYKIKKAEENAPIHTVTFAYQDGSVIKQKEVKEGKGVLPPNLETQGVFRGWSVIINNITSDVETHPMIYSINDENLFYFNSVYVEEGDEFNIDLMLGGEINISSTELTIKYDPKVMKFIRLSESELCNITNKEKGSLTVLINSNTPLTAEALISQITFKAKKKDVSSSRIDLICKNAKLVNEGVETSVTVSTLNNNIYYLQEVDMR